MNIEMKHLEFLQTVADKDVAELKRKEETYKGSWKKRGGVGAFMMMARKWDRLEGMAENANYGRTNYDVFRMIEDDPSGEDGSPLAEIRDLRRYLMLVEAEMIARNVVIGRKPERDEPCPRGLHVHQPGTPEDGGHHEKANQDDERRRELK